MSLLRSVLDHEPERTAEVINGFGITVRVSPQQFVWKPMTHCVTDTARHEQEKCVSIAQITQLGFFWLGIGIALIIEHSPIRIIQK